MLYTFIVTTAAWASYRTTQETVRYGKYTVNCVEFAQVSYRSSALDLPRTRRLTIPNDNKVLSGRSDREPAEKKVFDFINSNPCRCRENDRLKTTAPLREINALYGDTRMLVLAMIPVC